MIPNNTERSLYAALIPPGPAHIHAIRSMAVRSNRETVAVSGFWTSLPVDYMLRVSGRAHLDVADARILPAPNMDHPLIEGLLLRTLRLNCLTYAYGDLWSELYIPAWHEESWTMTWPCLAPLAAIDSSWSPEIPLRTEFARRAAIVELDVLVAIMLGIDWDDLSVLYRARFPQLVTYEGAMWFDSNGRRIAENFNAYGRRQSKAAYRELMDHLDNPEKMPPPEGFVPPFYKTDREAEYRQSHAVFSQRLERARTEGWRPGGERT
jgi:hypothetical protein